MRLVFSMPSTWRVAHGPGGAQRITLADAPADEIELVVMPLVALPDSFRSWEDSVLKRDVSPDAAVEVVTSNEGKTELGWPMRAVEVRVTDARGAVQHRVYFLLRLIDHGGAVVVSAARPELLEAHRATIAAAAHSARPDWSGGSIAAVAQLWEGMSWA